MLENAVISSYNHSGHCRDCGKDISESHVYGGVDGITCVVCGAKNHTHNYTQFQILQGANANNYHLEICECGVVNEWGYHEFADDVCTKCGYKKDSYVGISADAANPIEYAMPIRRKK